MLIALGGAAWRCEPEVSEAVDVIDAPAAFGAGFVEVGYAAPEGFLRPGLISGDPRGLTHAVAADLDGDGTTEVLFGAVAREGPAGTPFALRLSRDGRALTPISLEGVDPVGMPMALQDLDDDGRRDLLGAAPAIAWGEDGARFSAPTALTFGGRRAMVMGAAVEDLDGDGWLDLVLASKECCANCRALEVFLRVGPRRFEPRPDLLDEVPAGGAYAVLAARLGPDEMVLATLGNCASSEPTFFRATTLPADGVPRFTPFDPTPSEAQYRLPEGYAACPSLACRAPMGAWIGYIDEDDEVDLAVALNPRHELFRGRRAWPLPEVFTSPYTVTPAPETRRGMIPWGTAFADLDGDGRPDAIHVHGNDFIPDEDRARYIGPQHTTVHWNAGRMRFADITDRLGALRPRLGQWRSLFTHDPDGDGDIDLVVGGHGFMPVVFRNEIQTGRRGLSLSLRGTSSNRYGVGATVRVASPSRATRRLRMGGAASPHGIAEPLVFAGLGEDARRGRHGHLAVWRDQRRARPRGRAAAHARGAHALHPRSAEPSRARRRRERGAGAGHAA
ncbi:MAG: VCBS repeat-containing protein [Polyangiales bacterium]